MPLKHQITKDDLYKRLAQCGGIPEGAAAKMLEQLARIALTEVKANGAFLVPGIGMIEKVERSERTGVHPITGATIRVGRNVKLKFEFASRFKKKVLVK